jgi:hypothetical protein
MVTFRQRLDSSGKIYIRKVLQDIGFDKEIDVCANTRAAVIYPTGTSPETVLKSLSIIQQDLELRVQEHNRPEKRREDCLCRRVRP